MRLSKFTLLLVLSFVVLFVVASTPCAFADEDSAAAATATSSADDSVYIAPHPSRAFFFDTFQENGDPFSRGWVRSKAEEYSAQPIEWTSVKGHHSDVVGIPGDKGLLLAKEAQRYAFVHPVKTVQSDKGDFVVQYEVKFEKNLECGGAYIKLLRAGGGGGEDDLSQFKGDTPYAIMFGPDRCGSTDKVHFILQHRNPVTGQWEEKHMKNSPLIKNDQLTHVYTLVVRRDNTFEIFIDQESARKGSLLEDMNPPINPPKEIEDPEDKKPADWVDEEYIDDPDASKPADWVDVKTVPDPEAKQPEDWDVEEDGEWQPPQIPNPDYKGEWQAPKIRNPKYKGEWKPRLIANPNHFEDLTPGKTLPEVTALGVEIWTMQKNMYFDNFLITDDEKVAKEFSSATWAKKHALEKEQIPKAPEPGLTDQASEIFEQIKVIANQYPYVTIGVAASLFLTIPLSFLCLRWLFRGGDSSRDEARASVAAAAAASKKSDAETTAKKSDEAEPAEEAPKRETTDAAQDVKKRKKPTKD